MCECLVCNGERCLPKDATEGDEERARRVVLSRERVAKAKGKERRGERG